MSWALRSWTVVLGLSLSCAGFLTRSEPNDEEASQGDESPIPTRVIATLRTRERELTITSTGGRVRYSLVDGQGASQSLTLEQLQAQDPNLYEVVKSATASSSAQGVPRPAEPRLADPPFADARFEPDAPASKSHAKREAAGVPGGR